MTAATVGSLNVNATLQTAAFDKGIAQMQRQMAATQKKFAAAGAAISGVGQKLSIGLTAPFAMLMSKAIPAAKESREALGQVQAALKSMGPVAGRTAEQLQDAAKGLQKMSTFDDDDILRKVTANMLTFGNIAGEQFDRAQRAVVDLSARMGTDLQGAALMVGKALNDPAKGLAALRRVGIQFTAQQQEQIKAMTKAGNAAGAQRVMLAELERQFGGSAAAMRAADPSAALTNSWNDFQETIGEIALKVLPPLTNGLSGLVDKFNELSPRTQEIAVGAAAVAAALGPVLMVVGPLVTGMGALVPLIGAAGGAGLVGVLGPLAIAAGAVYLAFKNWATLGPAIEKWASDVKAKVAGVDADLQSFSARIDAMDKRLGLPSRSEIFTTLTEYVTRNVTESVARIDEFLASVDRFSRNFDAAIVNAGRSARIMYEQIKTWLSDKLNAVWNSLGDKVNTVKGWFANLYDAVVGHSYIPDMVDGIAAQMARLDAVMVAPAKAAAEKVSKAFRDLAAEVRPLLDRLFPEAADRRNMDVDIATLEKAGKAGILTPDQVGEAIGRRRVEGMDPAMPTLEGADTPLMLPTVDAEALDRIARQAVNLKSPMADLNSLGLALEDAFAGIGGTAGEAFAGITASIFTQVIPALQSAQTAAQQLQGAFSIIGQGIGVIVGAIFGKKAGRVAGAVVSAGLQIASSFGGFGGPRAKGGPVLSGKSYLVGENGPEMFTPRFSGSIIPHRESMATLTDSMLTRGANTDGGRREIVVTVTPSPLFEVKVDEKVGAMGVRVASAVPGLAMGAMARQQRRRLA